MGSLADEDYCYLTTTGRVSGEPREIEVSNWRDSSLPIAVDLIRSTA
jgi:hypothetical protein